MNSGGRGKGAASLLKSVIYVAHQALPQAHLNLMSVSHEIDAKRTGIKSFPCLISRTPTLTKKIKTIFSMSRCLIWAAIAGKYGTDINFLVNQYEKRLLHVYQNNDLILTCVADCLTDDFIISIPIGYLYLLSIGILLKKPVAILASQIGPFKNNITGIILSHLTKYILNRVNLLNVRDEQSLFNLHKMRVNKPSIHLTADIALLLKASTSERAKAILSQEKIDIARRPLVGINASPFAWKFSNPHIKNHQEKFAQYLEWMCRITEYLTIKLQATVIFIPHVFGPTKEEDGRETAYEIYQRLKSKKHVFIIKNEYLAEEMKAIFGQLDLMISTRMHPMIHSIAMGVPTVGIYYSFKVPELMKRVGQEQYVIAINKLNNDIFTIINKAYVQREQIQKELLQRVPALRRYSARNIQILRSFWLHNLHKIKSYRNYSLFSVFLSIITTFSYNNDEPMINTIF